MNPISPLLATFDEELIEIPLGAVGNIQQDVGIAQGLLYANTAAGDVPIGRLVACLAELSELKVLGKLCVLVYTYFSHNLSCLNSTYGAVTLCSSVAASEDHSSRLLVSGLGGAILHKLLHLLHQSVLLQTNHPGAGRTIVR